MSRVATVGGKDARGSYEVETTLVYSLPVDVGQGSLLREFWHVEAELESFVHRVTRVGSYSWRVGTTCRFPRNRPSSCTRLDILRFMTDDSVLVDETIVSQLKIRLTSDRSVRYEATIDLASNLKYPMVLEDRLSFELDTTREMERSLVNAEDDTSDGNLGVRFAHRLSFRATDVESATKREVRVSLRATLNEYHEASYHLELECEKDPDAVESPLERRSRHDAVARIFARIVLPWLKLHWSDGLRAESVRPIPPKCTLDDASTIRMTTRRSFLTNARLRNAVATRNAESVVKLKYDGERCYGFFALGEFWINCSVVQCGDSNKSLLSGLLVYQIERVRRRAHQRSGESCDEIDLTISHETANSLSSSTLDIVTEIVFALDHRELVAIDGGGALCRQIEYTEYAGSIEQRCVETAYLMADGTDLWPSLSSAALWRGTVIDELAAFVDCCSREHGSYATDARTRASSPMIAVDWSKLIATGRLRLSPAICQLLNAFVFSARTDASPGVCDDRNRRIYVIGETREQFARRILRSNADRCRDALVGRALLSVTLDYSNAVLRRMWTEWSAPTINDGLAVSRPFVQANDDDAALWDLFANSRSIVDGLVISRSVSSYEKLKLRQTVELAVTWDCAALLVRNAILAVRVTPFAGESTNVSHWKLTANGASLTVLNLTQAPLGRSSICEFEHVSPYVARFVRWRADKKEPDSLLKTLVVLRGDIDNKIGDENVDDDDNDDDERDTASSDDESRRSMALAATKRKYRLERSTFRTCDFAEYWKHARVERFRVDD